MNFLPLTDVLQQMTENFVDEDCRKQCFDMASRMNSTGQELAMVLSYEIALSVNRNHNIVSTFSAMPINRHKSV